MSLNSIFVLLMILLMFNTASYQDTLRNNAQLSTISEPLIQHIAESSQMEPAKISPENAKLAKTQELSITLMFHAIKRLSYALNKKIVLTITAENNIAMLIVTALMIGKLASKTNVLIDAVY